VGESQTARLAAILIKFSVSSVPARCPAVLESSPLLQPPCLSTARRSTRRSVSYQQGQETTWLREAMLSVAPGVTKIVVVLVVVVVVVVAVGVVVALTVAGVMGTVLTVHHHHSQNRCRSHPLHRVSPRPESAPPTRGCRRA
jgi:Flp pilus assembly protein TadB